MPFLYLYALVAVVDRVDVTLLIAGSAVVMSGWLPFLAKGRGRLKLTLLAAVVAVPLSRLCLAMPMHDLSVSWRDHDRWCIPLEGRIVTSQTLPFLLFSPIVLWAARLLTTARDRSE